MNTDTKTNIDTSIYIRTNADTTVNNHTCLHFHAGIMVLLYKWVCYILTMILIFVLVRLLATIQIFATICFEDRNLRLL